MNLPQQLNKDKIKFLLITGAVVAICLFVTNKLVVAPIMDILNHSEELSQKESTYDDKLRELDTTARIVQKKQEKYENDSVTVANLMTQVKDMSFTNMGSLEKFVESIAVKENVNIITIGGMERIDTTADKYSLLEIHLPYIIEGTEKDVFDFIGALEDTDKYASLMDSSILLETTDNNIRVTFKVGTFLLEDTELVEIGEIPIKQIMEGIKSQKTLNINGHTYVILTMKDNKRQIYSHNEEIDIDGIKYSIDIRQNGIFCKKLGEL